jgi:hypothetical protein
MLHKPVVGQMTDSCLFHCSPSSPTAHGQQRGQVLPFVNDSFRGGYRGAGP